MELGDGVARHVDSGSVCHHPGEVLLPQVVAGNFIHMC